jgi:hypothetical protein
LIATRKRHCRLFYFKASEEKGQSRAGGQGTARRYWDGGSGGPARAAGGSGFYFGTGPTKLPLLTIGQLTVAQLWLAAILPQVAAKSRLASKGPLVVALFRVQAILQRVVAKLACLNIPVQIESCSRYAAAGHRCHFGDGLDFPRRFPRRLHGVFTELFSELYTELCTELIREFSPTLWTVGGDGWGLRVCVEFVSLCGELFLFSCVCLPFCGGTHGTGHPKAFLVGRCTEEVHAGAFVRVPDGLFGLLGSGV